LIDVEAFHVDGASGDDGNDGLTKETAFATIQKGVDTAEDGCEVLVWPGTYDENVSFGGKAITVRSADEPAVVSPTTGYAFEFFSAEGPDSVLKNFIIADGQYGIHVDIGCSPTITNLTIANNDFGISAVGNADPNISNCIFYNNTYGDIEGCEAKYSLFSGDLDGGLISYWNLDEGQGDTAYDSVGSNHGTLYGPNWTTGQIGGALNFDGTDDYVEITNSTNLQKPLPITLSAWARISPDGDRDVILSLDNQTNYYCGIEFGISTAMLFYVHAGDALGTGPAHRKNVLGTTVLMTDTWYHLVAVVGSMDDMRLYVNGVLEEPNPASSGTATTMDYCENNALIGCREGSSSSYFFGGVIDEVAVWDRALDSGEIQQIYTDGLAAHMMGADPLFADAGAGDYHLLSERGRYWPDYDVWVLDSQTSPAIDGGNPIQNPGDEPMPNGGRINMGAYGGTAWASMSEWPLEGDINQDGIVNLADVGIVAVEWLSSLLWIE
jgi:parallel beta-helix repeat protein